MSIHTKRDILNYLQEHYDDFKNLYNVNKIGLFGSFARDEATNKSDIDIFVDMKPNLYNMIAIKDKIEKDLKRKVDLVREHKNIKPILLKMIKKDLIYVK